MRGFLRLLFCLLIAASQLAPSLVGAAEPGDTVGQYIVRLQADASVDAVIDDHVRPVGGSVLARYSSAINGFSALMTTDAADALRADKRVHTVMADVEVIAFAQTVPTGVTRIGTPSNTTADIDGVDERVNVDVAVLDTGVSPHSDLNIAGGVDCTDSGSYADGNGHGTHVAGTIGAKDNSSGVVGVAPGARIWSVRVLNAAGSGSGTTIVCGIDWVTAHASTIEVANMSLGGTGITDDNNCGNTNGDIIHQAICESVGAGVTYVVAAGNDGVNASNTFPANYNEVITVSALVDTDGKAGGLGSGTQYGADDTLASFSNYGADVDVIAPGVAILSTSRTGGLTTMSGTSMASPHAAGAAALYKAKSPSASPSTVRSYLIQTGSTSGWTGDRDNTKEPLISVAGSGGGGGGGGGTSMSVSALTLSKARLSVGYRITTRVTVKAGGTPVGGAMVLVEMQYPNGTKYSLSGMTTSTGIAVINRNVTANGTYVVTVKNVTKSGYTYNAAGNAISSASISIP